MMQLKKLLLILFLIVGMQYSYSQIYKFQTTGFSVLEKNDKGDWGKWSDLENTSLVITLDTNKNRIIIYSQEIQLYRIVNYETKQVSGDDEINAFACSNDDGEPFVISIITRKNQGNRKQLYINQKKNIIVYNIENFTDSNKK